MTGIRHFAAAGLAVLAWLGTISQAQASPHYSRQYQMSCPVCHAAAPVLNEFGQRFADNGRLPNWREAVSLQTGDEMLDIPRSFPLSLRAQGAFFMGRGEERLDYRDGGVGGNANLDTTAPYLLKLITSHPFASWARFHMEVALAPEGRNGDSEVRESWFRLRASNDEEASSLVLGQFRLGDLLLDSDQRLSFQRYIPLDLAGYGLDRGARLDMPLGWASVHLGLANGAGIDDNYPVTTPGLGRTRRSFDNNSQKDAFGAVKVRLGSGSRLTLFGLAGEQAARSGDYGELASTSAKAGRLQFAAALGGLAGYRLHWYSLLLWNRWDDFLKEDDTHAWLSSMVGFDFAASDHFALSLRYNYANAGTLAGSDTIFEGIDLNTITLTASFFPLRNIRFLVEVNMDFLPADQDADFVGHENKEDYLLLGVDLSY